VKRLVESIENFNTDKIPFYVSVPSSDLVIFQENLAGRTVVFVTDEEIIRANPYLVLEKINSLPGSMSQQIVKSEFWRLEVSESYLCLDSDCVFIRPFCLSDFVAPDGFPFTIVHESKELLQFSVRNGMQKVSYDFHRERQQIMKIFGRVGHHYDFGPAPLLWSGLVWKALDENYLIPNNINFYDAIVMFPGEIQWYGESMLKYRPFPLTPVEPLFKVYLYERQYILGKRQGETVTRLANDYIGVCYQSNWDSKSNIVQKPMLSRLARWIRRVMFRRYS
jgi:hypothetical protein